MRVIGLRTIRNGLEYAWAVLPRHGELADAYVGFPINFVSSGFRLLRNPRQWLHNKRTNMELAVMNYNLMKLQKDPNTKSLIHYETSSLEKWRDQQRPMKPEAQGRFRFIHEFNRPDLKDWQVDVETLTLPEQLDLRSIRSVNRFLQNPTLTPRQVETAQLDTQGRPPSFQLAKIYMKKNLNPPTQPPDFYQTTTYLLEMGDKRLWRLTENEPIPLGQVNGVNMVQPQNRYYNPADAERPNRTNQTFMDRVRSNLNFEVIDTYRPQARQMGPLNWRKPRRRDQDKPQTPQSIDVQAEEA